MAYKVEWEIPEAVLSLKLSGAVTFDDFVEIDRLINEKIKQLDSQAVIKLLVDVTHTSSVPQFYQRLSSTQTYANQMNSPLKHIMIVSGDNKLMRLVMLLVFNLCRPTLLFFKSHDQALAFALSSNSVKPQGSI